MRAIDFIYATLSHIIRDEDGPPPGIPARITPQFEQELTWHCEWHSLTSIVMDSLSRLALPPGVSRVTTERMRALSAASHAATSRTAKRAREIDAHLQEAGAEVAFCDDTAVAVHGYRGRVERPAGTLTIMVSEHDFDRALSVCSSLGYRRVGDPPPLPDGQTALEYYHYFVPCLLTDEHGDYLRIVFRVFDVGPPESSESAWGRVNREAKTVRMVLSVEDQLIRSALKTAISKSTDLLHMLDVAMLLVRHADRIDWRYIADRLSKTSMQCAAFMALQHVQRSFNLPEETVGISAPGPVRHALFWLIWRPRPVSAFVSRRSRVHRFWFPFMEMGSLKTKLRFLWWRLFPKREWVAAFFQKPYQPWHRVWYLFRIRRNRPSTRHLL